MKLNKEIFEQTSSQTKTSGTVMPKVYRIGRGVDPNLRPGNEEISSLSTSGQLHVQTDSKGQFRAKPRIGQSRTNMKRMIIQRFPMT